jgi:hypothetical protein
MAGTTVGPPPLVVRKVCPNADAVGVMKAVAGGDLTAADLAAWVEVHTR